MTYAVIRLGGKQFKVHVGEKIELERQENANADVLLYSDGNEVYLGEPVLTDYEVTLKEVEQKRGKKVRVGRFKAKSRYRKVRGHRQPLSVFEVKSIGKKSARNAKKREETAKTSEETLKTVEKPVQKKEAKRTEKTDSNSKDKGVKKVTTKEKEDPESKKKKGSPKKKQEE